MKKLIAIATIAVLSLNFVSCRQEDESADFNNNSNPNQKVFGKKANNDTVKTDTLKSFHKSEVDPDPPVKDGTSW